MGGGDYNGDSVEDILFTASYFFSGPRGFHIIFSRKNIPGSNYKAFRTYSGDRSYYLAGYPSNAGDVNGDGVDDVIIGAPGEPVTTQAGFFGIYSGDSNIVTAVAEEPDQPESFLLEQNYPNPFNPSTTISYSIIEPSEVTLSVYDYLGREVAMLVNNYQDVGTYSVNFDASKLASGIYFYKLQAGKNVEVKKMLILK